MSSRTWLQAKLPVSLGGLGLRAAEDHAPAAHAASVLSLQLLKQSLTGGRGARQPVAGDGDELDTDLSAGLLAAMSAAQGEAASEADLVEGFSTHNTIPYLTPTHHT